MAKALKAYWETQDHQPRPPPSVVWRERGVMRGTGSRPPLHPHQEGGLSLHPFVSLGLCGPKRLLTSPLRARPSATFCPQFWGVKGTCKSPLYFPLRAFPHWRWVLTPPPPTHSPLKGRELRYPPSGGGIESPSPPRARSPLKRRELFPPPYKRSSSEDRSPPLLVSGLWPHHPSHPSPCQGGGVKAIKASFPGATPPHPHHVGVRRRSAPASPPPPRGQRRTCLRARTVRGRKTAPRTMCRIGTLTHLVPLLPTTKATTAEVAPGGAPPSNMSSPKAPITPDQIQWIAVLGLGPPHRILYYCGRVGEILKWKKVLAHCLVYSDQLPLPSFSGRGRGHQANWEGQNLSQRIHEGPH